MENIVFKKSLAQIASFTITVIVFLSCTFSATSATIVPDTQKFEKAKVLEVSDTNTSNIPGVDLPVVSQTLKVEILEGDDEGNVVIFKNDYTQLKVGDTFYARHQWNGLDGTDNWSVSDPYRLDVLGYLALGFLILLFVFGGKQGVRGLASLVGSIGLIFYILVPSIYAGYNAVLISILVSSFIIILGSYITHGFNRTTSSAVLGMISTVLVTGATAYYVVYAAHLSGFSSEESTFLHMDTKGSIDMVGLLFGGIIIGLLGVLYDIAIGQAVSVEELYAASDNSSRFSVYTRALRIGREHIGALVNTLAIAYVGASLPLILLIQSATTGVLFILNSEVFATEIVRILIGSIGLVLAVPITTLIASYMLYGKVFRSEDLSPHGHKH